MHAIASEHEILIDKLQIALENETSAHIRYREFAEKADGEGWHGVASLFRAIARSEEIHAQNHARVLHQCGAERELKAPTFDVHMTIDNVRASVAEELVGVDTVYPGCTEMARTARDVAMVRTFTWALAAERTHARLLNEALALLEIEDEDSWITMARDFYVCPVCGYTSEYEDEEEVCPSCFCSRGRFETVR